MAGVSIEVTNVVLVLSDSYRLAEKQLGGRIKHRRTMRYTHSVVEAGLSSAENLSR
jgi:hypothetical protein